MCKLILHSKPHMDPFTHIIAHARDENLQRIAARIGAVLDVNLHSLICQQSN